jgi:hypothetical protein
MYIGLHVKNSYSSKILIKIDFSRQIFEKYSNIEFHENPSNGIQVVPCGRTDRRHDKVIVALPNFTNVLKNGVFWEEPAS